MIQLTSAKPAMIHTSPFQAFVYAIWVRHRLSYIKTSLGCLAAIIVEYVVPRVGPGDNTVSTAFRESSRDLTGYVGLALFLLCFWLALTVGTSARTDCPPTATTIYPNSLFPLPVTTRNLVIVPLLIGNASVIFLWGLFTITTWSLNLGFPVVLPVLLLIFALSSSQTMGWVNMSRQGIGCLMVATGVFSPLLAKGALAIGCPESIIDLAIASMIVLSVAMALEASPNARHSIPVVKNERKLAYRARKARLSEQSNDGQALPFRSVVEAQAWFNQALKLDRILPAMTMITTIGFLIHVAFGGPIRIQPTAVNPNLISYPGENGFAVQIGIGQIFVAPAAFHFILCVPIVLFLGAIFLKMGWSVFATPATKSSGTAALPPFIAIRPISSVDLLGSRFLSSRPTIIRTTSILWVACLLCLLAPAKENGHDGPLLLLLLSHITTRGGCLAVIGALSIPFLLFCSLFDSPSDTFMKRIGLVRAKGIEIPLLCSIFVGSLFVKITGNGSLLLPLIAPLIGIVLVTLKATCVWAASRKLQANRLLSKSEIRKATGLWLIIATALAGVFVSLNPTAKIPSIDVALLAILVLPANRILWQILKIDSMRHG